jgi:hypothetical protein
MNEYMYNLHKYTANHGVLVHSCVARDDGGNSFKLIDEKGSGIRFKKTTNSSLSRCSLDPIGLGDVTYSSDLSMAHVESHAFKFADKLQINFACELTLCIKLEDGCRGITVGRICRLS